MRRDACFVREENKLADLTDGRVACQNLYIVQHWLRRDRIDVSL